MLRPHGQTVAVSFVVRPAAMADAEAIGEVHVASWRWAYAGLMPADGAGVIGRPVPQ